MLVQRLYSAKAAKKKRHYSSRSKEAAKTDYT